MNFQLLQPFHVDIPDGALFYLPEWYTRNQANHLYQRLLKEIDWSQDEIFVYGKWHVIPRLQAWYGEPNTAYQYSGKQLVPKEWTQTLSQLRAHLQKLGIQSNSVLANWYRDGHDKMGWHSDNEKELGDQPVIASLSLGATRSFQLKHRYTGQRLDLELSSGSLLVMAGTLQKYWQHALPARKRVSQGRINLTFRSVQEIVKQSS